MILGQRSSVIGARDLEIHGLVLYLKSCAWWQFLVRQVWRSALDMVLWMDASDITYIITRYAIMLCGACNRSYMLRYRIWKLEVCRYHTYICIPFSRDIERAPNMQDTYKAHWR